MKTYDAIVVGAGHNGLANAAFLAKAGLDVVCVEKNDYIGGATVSRSLYDDWIYSNCSYVCSLLRPEIYRALDEGYRVLDVREVHHFSDHKRGLFAQFVDTFLKAKQEAYGWPKVSLLLL